MSKSGQVWVETVTYTLIALIMIGLVLSYVKPKIEQIQDKAIIDQSADVLKNVDNIILSIKDIPGNQRLIDIGIKKGEFIIDGIDNKISFQMDSTDEYSEPGENLSDGKMIVYTEKKGKINTVTLTFYYNGKYNITYMGEHEIKEITQSPTSYKILISNKGKDSDGNAMIDFEVTK
jgi:hypothetical protein